MYPAVTLLYIIIMMCLLTFSLGKNNETYMQSNSMVKVFTHGVMHRRIGGPIELFLFSSQCSMTGVTKAVVCAILSVG